MRFCRSPFCPKGSILSECVFAEKNHRGKIYFFAETYSCQNSFRRKADLLKTIRPKSFCRKALFSPKLFLPKTSIFAEIRFAEELFAENNPFCREVFCRNQSILPKVWNHNYRRQCQLCCGRFCRNITLLRIILPKTVLQRLHWRRLFTTTKIAMLTQSSRELHC